MEFITELSDLHQILSDIQQAVRILQAGGIVAFPTETVYGLGADARNSQAVRKIFHIKQRPMNHPLIVHIAEIEEMYQWATHITDDVLKVAKAFWPGPLTLILPKKPDVLDIVTGSQQTIALRIPQHPVSQLLLRAFKGGIAAPSANKFKYISPTTAEAVMNELGEEIDFILDGGGCVVGVESTILDMSGDSPNILRPGMISATDIKKILPHFSHEKNNNTKENIRAPGMLQSHYAPKTKVKLMDMNEINKLLDNIKHQELPIAFMSHSKHFFETVKEGTTWINMPKEPKEYAQELYRTLRELDKENFKYIVIEHVPQTIVWEAIADRIKKASY